MVLTTRAAKRKVEGIPDPAPAVEKKTAANVKAPRRAVAPRKNAPPKEKPEAPKTAAVKAAEKKAAAAKTAATKAAAKKAAVAEKAAATKAAKKVAAEKKAATAKAADKKGPATKVAKKVAASKAIPSKKAATTTVAAKKQKAVPPPKKGRVEKPLPILTTVPTQKVNVYTFGKGDFGELGLGPASNAGSVTRPRLNKYLLPDEVGVVSIAIGGMHGLALTHEGKLYSWGVNDLCALGRDTKTPRAERASSVDSDDEINNPLESIPAPVEGFPEGTVITRIAAGDSISVAITDTGKVYAWGAFRGSDGLLGFSPAVKIQPRPLLIPQVKKAISVSIGDDHVIVLTSDGHVFSWGYGEQAQLGYRVVDRHHLHALTARRVLQRKRCKFVATGCFHSFAIGRDGKVWAWGLNQFSQCGIFDAKKAGKDFNVVSTPTLVTALSGYDIVQIVGGLHHSAALTAEGDLLVWGRLQANQLGIDVNTLPKDGIYFDETGARYLYKPTIITDRKFAHIACGTDHSMAIARDGSLWTWGSGICYQTGHGPNLINPLVPTKVENSAVKGLRMVQSGAGAQFTTVTGYVPEANGINEAEEE